MDTGRIISGIVAVLGVLVISSANLTDLFGQGTARLIVSASGLIMSILSALNAVMFQGQAAHVQAVEAMPGVSRIITNPQANATLAALAASDDHPKVETIK